MSELIERQEVRETNQLDEGIARYHAQIAAVGVGDTKTGLPLVFVAMKAMIPWIKENVRMLEDGETHPSHVPLGIHWLCEMNAEAVSYIAAKICVTSAYCDGKTTRTAMKIANLIEENYRYEQLLQAEPALANSMAQKAARWSRTRTRRKIMRKAADVAGIKRMGWTEKEKVKLGLKLIEVFVEQSGLGEQSTVQDRDRGCRYQKSILRLTPIAWELIEQGNVTWEDSEPVNRPIRRRLSD
jgi:DNA-directed RNA polymerase